MSGTGSEVEPFPKRKMKLGLLDGYLGRQLGVSGLLSPVNRDHKLAEPDGFSSATEKGTGSEQAGTINMEAGHPTDNRKRAQAHSDEKARESSGQHPMASLPQSRLRPSAAIFQPGVDAFRLIPKDQKSFSFGPSMTTQSPSEPVESAPQLQPGAAVFKPRLPAVPTTEPLPEVELSDPTSDGTNACYGTDISPASYVAPGLDGDVTTVSPSPPTSKSEETTRRSPIEQSPGSPAADARYPCCLACQLYLQ